MTEAHRLDPSDPDAPKPGTDRLWLLIGCIGLWAWSAGLWDLWGPDETRYVQIAREVLRGHWLALTENGASYGQKPPLPFWMLAAMLKLHGGEISNWLVRLPSLFFATLTVLLTYDIGLKRLSRDAGWVAGWMMLTAPLLLAEAPSARLDVLMAGFVTLSLWAILARPADAPLGGGRVALHWLGLLGAFFIKGPLVFLIVWGVVIAEVWRLRSARPIGELKPLVGIPFLAVSIGVWLLALQAAAPGGYVGSMVNSATTSRLFDPKLHGQPFFYYLGVILGDGFAPWGFFLACAIFILIVDGKTANPDLQALRALLVWAFLPTVFLSLLSGKREQYLLAMLPAMALISGWYVDCRLWERAVPGGIRLGMTALAALAATAALVFAFMNFTGSATLQNAQFRTHPLQGLLLLGVAALMARLVIECLRLERWPQAVGILVAAILGGSVAVYGAVLPGMNASKSTRAFSQAIDARLKTLSQSGVQAPDGGGSGTGIVGPYVGAMGKAQRPQFQVYGHYTLVEVPSKAGALNDTAIKSLPPIIIGEPDDFADTSIVLDYLKYKQFEKTSKRLDAIEARVR